MKTTIEIPEPLFRKILTLARAKLKGISQDEAEENVVLSIVQLRSIAEWKRKGYKNEEIATMLGWTSRTLERKLKLIRMIWGEEDPS